MSFWRFFGRVCSSSSIGRIFSSIGFRYRRVYLLISIFLWSGWNEVYLWFGFLLWVSGLCFFYGLNWVF